MRMTAAFITHHECLKHEMGAYHPERPARLTAIEDQLIASGVGVHLSRHEAPLATDEQLSRVHPIEYVRAIRDAAPNFVATNANDAAYWDTCFAGTAPPCATKYSPTGANALPASGAGALAEAPRYIIEQKPDVGATQIYRVTARAVGGTADAVVVLQAEFGYTP